MDRADLRQAVEQAVRDEMARVGPNQMPAKPQNALPAEGRGQHGVYPLSGCTRTRLLAGLLQRAESGDVAAAEVLIRLGAEAGCVSANRGRRRGEGAPSSTSHS